MVERIQDTMMRIIRTYQELLTFETFEERYEYLRLVGVVGESTFGYDRYLNQLLYTSRRWRTLRDTIIIRDDGCDLGIKERDIGGMIIIHHMNPLTSEDIEDGTDAVFNPDYLICVSTNTHTAIHFGDSSLLHKPLKDRELFDTAPWRK